MESLSGLERIARILNREPVDRIGLYEHIWGSTRDAWVSEGNLEPDEAPEDFFAFDMAEVNPFNMKADIEAPPEVLEEKDGIETVRDGNGALFRRRTDGVAGNQYFDYLVKGRAEWEEHIKPRLVQVSQERINFQKYREAKERAARAGRFFCWTGLNVFELMRTVCGHQNMFLGMGLDPAWIHDMVNTYAELTIDLQETLFAREGEPDGIWFSEDLGYKGTPFMSNDMYREFLQPAHSRTFGYAHSRNLPVIMHSCGMIEPLLPLILETGIDCLEAMEVKAGMDVVRLYQNYGETLSFIGGIETSVVAEGDKSKIDELLSSIIPTVMKNFGYVLHSDHSIPDNVAFESYRYFVERGLEMGTYR